MDTILGNIRSVEITICFYVERYIRCDEKDCDYYIRCIHNGRLELQRLKKSLEMFEKDLEG